MDRIFRPTRTVARRWWSEPTTVGDCRIAEPGVVFLVGNTLAFASLHVPCCPFAARQTMIDLGFSALARCAATRSAIARARPTLGSAIVRAVCRHSTSMLKGRSGSNATCSAPTWLRRHPRPTRPRRQADPELFAVDDSTPEVGATGEFEATGGFEADAAGLGPGGLSVRRLAERPYGSRKLCVYHKCS